MTRSEMSELWELREQVNPTAPVEESVHISDLVRSRRDGLRRLATAVLLDAPTRARAGGRQ